MTSNINKHLIIAKSLVNFNKIVQFFCFDSNFLFGIETIDSDNRFIKDSNIYYADKKINKNTSGYCWFPAFIKQPASGPGIGLSGG